MTELRIGSRLRPLFTASALAVLAVASCSDDEEDDAGDGGSGQAGESGSASGGSTGARGGTSGKAGSGGSSARGGGAGDDAVTGGSAGTAGTATGGGAGAGGSPGDAGSTGDGGSAGGDTTPACDPAGLDGSQGCPDDEKCTWLSTSETTGQLGCVPSGSVPKGGECSESAAGTRDGATYDDCEAGLVCVASRCQDICDFDGGAGSTCASGDACVRVDGLFADGFERPSVGVCSATCDPLTQTRIVGGAPTTCGVNQGCYLVAGRVDTVAICARAGTPTHNQPITGSVFSNSCAPGHTARRTQPGASTWECTAFCKPADVYVGSNDGVSGRPTYEGGDSRSPNWQNLPATCESAGGASVRPEVPDTGESCRYFWSAEGHDFLTSFSNTLGWCVPHASWLYDPAGGTNRTTPWPRCTTLTTGDVLPPLNGQSDALDWGCSAKPEPATLALGSGSGTISAPDGVYLDRLSAKP